MSSAVAKDERPRGQGWTREETALIIQLREQHKGWRDIAQLVGKTALACRLRMNQIRKAQARASSANQSAASAAASQSDSAQQSNSGGAGGSS